MKSLFNALFLSLFLYSSAVQCQTKQIKKLDEYLSQAMTDWNVPGMEVLIMKDGEVLLEKGYGVRNTENQEPVSENTLMAIASNSKAFTSAALAMLVDEGKISWDDKVIDYLPFFRLYDEYVTQQMTVRDLLCHRSGLGTFSGDLLWYGTKYSRREVVEKARFLEPESGFREDFGYQNIMFIAAGLVVEKVEGISWDEFVQTRILDPLGMSNTISSTLDLKSGMNYSAPHNDVKGKQVPIEWVNWDNMAPAGSLISSVSELKYWLQAHLNSGVFKNDTLWSAERTREMWTLETAENISSWSEQNFPSKTFEGYGLGWQLYNYQGHKVVGHGGGYDGFISNVAMVPDENIAVVVLTNTNTWLPQPLTYKILDELLCDKKAEKKDWSKFYLDIKNWVDAEDAKEEEAKKEARIEGTEPSLDLSAYEGVYRSDAYGDIIIRRIADELAFQFEPTPLFRGNLRHWHYDTFQLNWGVQMMLPSGTMNFILDASGQVSEVKVDVPNPDLFFTEFEFKKVE